MAALACASNVRRLLLHPGAGAPARSFYSQPYQERLLETRTLRLKKLGVPCKHRKLILSFAHKYRLGLWKPRAEARKVQ
ncbi:hypothetical protein CFC21_046671 [Triticum aestivum]|uniref:Small ribosomal subunit protein mS41 SAM domain-containing protein n=1 Tax=Triticum aestivum TaxID=4565 RepID=A0A9R1K029_WHEAT|nr:hypothetical protein CFC21_046671 [Triticum aestivum]